MKYLLLVLVAIISGCASPGHDNVKVWDDPRTPGEIAGFGGGFGWPPTDPWRSEMKDIMIGIDAQPNASVGDIVAAAAKHTGLDIRCEGDFVRKCRWPNGLQLRHQLLENLLAYHCSAIFGGYVTNRGDIILIKDYPNKTQEGTGDSSPEPSE